jgi:DNA-binding transcriptional LysR family regulator
MDLLATMRLYTRVVERGNVSLAARELGISQPTISERLARLEQHVGAQLIHRNARSLHPTDIGQEFYARSKKALELASIADDTPNALLSSSLRGSLRISVPFCLGGLELPIILNEFRSLHPELTYELNLYDGNRLPSPDGADTTIQFAPGQGTGQVSIPIGSQRYMLVASPEYVSRHGCIESATALKDHPFVEIVGDVASNEIILQAEGQIFPVSIATAWTVSNWRTAATLVMNCEGIGILPEATAKQGIFAGRLQRILPDHDIPSRSIYLLHAPAHNLPRKIAATIDHIRSHVARST